MKNLILPALLATLMAGSLGAAAKASIVVRGSTEPLVAYVIESEALVGVAWRSDRVAAGRTVPIWELVHVRYDGNMFDQYNSMAGRQSPQQARRLLEDAESYIKDADANKVPSMMNEAEWSRVVLACRYFVGYALMMQNKHQEAVDKLIEYLKAAEAKPADVGLPAPYKSPHSGKEIARAGGLHRLYLDALENLGKCYMALGDVQNANDKAFKPLQALGETLAQRMSSVEFYDWPLRGLRTMAASNEAAKNFKEARAAYEALEKIARAKDKGQASRVSYEASLKVGYMMVKDGDAASARIRFFEAVNRWERSAHGEDQFGNAQPPRSGWISPDLAYHTAGSYVGQGMIDATKASSTQEWSSALKNFSMALSVFRSDDEIRSMALLGAAEAASKLAEASASKADTAANYAKLSEKYLMELTSQLPKTASAQSESVAEIEKRVAKFKK